MWAEVDAPQARAVEPVGVDDHVAGAAGCELSLELLGSHLRMIS